MNNRIMIDDVTLSAWLDDELDAEQSCAVMTAVEAHDDLKVRVGEMMLNDRRLREHYAAVTCNQPVPEAIHVMLADEAPARRPWFLRLSDWTMPAVPRPVLTGVAFAAVLAVGVQFGTQFGTHGTPTEAFQSLTSIDNGHVWFELLDATAAGHLIELPNEVSGQVVLSYRDESGKWCRQFEIQSPKAREMMSAVACRESSQWRLGLAQLSPLVQSGPDVYRAASGDDSHLIDEFVLQRMDGDLVLGVDEMKAIEQRWP